MKHEIIYDGIGNPLVYRDGWEFEWTRGRSLERALNLCYDINYKYDGAGIRTCKTVNGVTTKFVTSGIQVLAQRTGDDVITWQIDWNGIVVGFNRGGTQYFYLKNAQGDVIGITDTSGNVIASYTYDSWGKLISVKGLINGNLVDITDVASSTDGQAHADHIGHINPIRYRGYYYDSETELYYLNSRYYDPETGRFLSKDDEQYLKNNDKDICNVNLYSYCLNNPVNMVDYDGHNPYALSVLLLNPELAVFALTVTAVMTPMLLANPKIKGIVDSAISWAIQSCVDSASAIYAKFRELGQMLSSKIADLVKAYNIYLTKQSVPSSLKISDDRVDLSKFTEPGQMHSKGPRGKKGPNGWTIVKVVGVAHKDDVWKLFDKAGRRVASLLADGTIIGK